MTGIAAIATPRLEHGQDDPTIFAPRRARSFVDDLPGRCEWDGVRATVALLTSELMTDAFRKHQQPSL